MAAIWARGRPAASASAARARTTSRTSTWTSAQPAGGDHRLSGSGKSSLAFDTLYAEGQRRYVESLSAYARQFLGRLDKPDVDLIEGLSPAISIEQKATSHNPRSTVGTVTEINDYLRLLYARAGTPYCPDHGLPLQAQTVSQMVDACWPCPKTPS
jgi:excinuclease ABC subunit A